MNVDMSKRQDLFETMPIMKAIMIMSLPMVLSSLVTILYNLSDTFFVATLNDSLQTAAVTLSAPILLSFNIVNNLFGVGSSSLMSRMLGIKKFDIVKKVSNICFYCCVGSGVIFSLLFIFFEHEFLVILGVDLQTMAATQEYMFWTVKLGATPAILNVVMAYLVRSEGASLQASIGTMSGCFLNIILDPFFVLPQYLNMGVAGAGMATFISNCIACLYFIVFIMLKRKQTFIDISLLSFHWDWKIIKEIFVVGIPAAIQNLLSVISMTVLNHFTVFYGVDAVSAMGISHKIVMIPLQVVLGFSQGIMPLISYNYANRNVQRMRNVLYVSLKFSISILIVLCIIFMMFASYLMSIFVDIPHVIQMGSVLIRFSCVQLPFLCIDYVTVCVFQACGLGGYALIFAILRKIVLEIPFLYLWDYLYPFYGLSIATPTTEVILAIIAIIKLKKILTEQTKRL